MSALSPDICVCPFNKAHILPSTSLQKHIIKCMVKYPNHKTCPYNALHRFLNEQEYIKHLMECPNKDISWMKLNYPIHGDLRQQNTQLDNAREINLKYEDWDKN